MQYIGAVFALIFVIIAVFFLSPVSSSLHSMEYLTGTETGNVTTAAGETAGNITLSEDVYRDAVTSITDVSSTSISDVPYASAYDTTTGNLTVSGLAASTSRLISVDYRYDNADNPVGLSSIISTTVIVIVLAFIFLLLLVPTGIVIQIWSWFRGSE